MSPLRVKALIRKEFIQILRDYRSLWMAIAIPVMMLVLFGYALTLDVDNVLFVVWDQDQTSLSRDFLLNFKGSPYFHLEGHCDTYSCIEDTIDTSAALMALVVPRDFSKLLQARQVAPVQLLADGSDSNTALIAMGYADAITAAYNKKYLREAMTHRGARFIEPVEMRPRVWFNETLKSRNFIIPGLIAVIMMIVSTLLTGLTVAREWERGTMEQLISTPMKPAELMVGKFIPYFIIGLFDVLLAVLMGQFIFHVPLRGNVFILFGLSGLFLTVTLSWGLFISVVTKSQFMASQVAFLTTFLPAFLLSGFAFPIANMPAIIQLITYVVPARYFVTIVKGIYLKGVGLEVLWPQAIPLVLFSVVLVNLTRMRFKKTIL